MNPPASEAKKYTADTLASFIDMTSVSNDGKITAKTGRSISTLQSGSYSFFRDGDITCAKMMSSADSMKCAIVDKLTNGIGFGSGEFYTFRADNNLLENREAAWTSVTGTGRLRVPLKFFETILIPLLLMDIRHKIVEKCLAVDAQAASLNARISSCHEQIEALLLEVDAMPSASTFAFDDKRYFSPYIGKRILNS